MDPLTASQILFLHAQLAARAGLPRGVADARALAAALAEAADPAPGAGLFERAAGLAAALARHRPFHAANHAFAAAAAGMLLRQFGLDLQLASAEMPALRALLAAGDSSPLAGWLRAHTVPLP
jgi:prophage maintenance system killer protein